MPTELQPPSLPPLNRQPYPTGDDRDLSMHYRQEEFELLGRLRVIPPIGGQGDPEDSIPLEPSETIEKGRKKTKKRVLYNWTRSIWIRRAMRNQETIQKHIEESKSPTARGLWKIAGFAVALALYRPNQIVQVPKQKSDQIKGFRPDIPGGIARGGRIDL